METTLDNYREKTVHARDVITGFRGIVTGHADYITGCDQWLIQPDATDKTYNEAKWFDENRLEIVDTTEARIKEKGLGVNDNGCDMPAPVK